MRTQPQQPFTTAKQLTFFKTWNWLKYYHPDFATGQRQADSVFLEYQPQITQAKTSKQLNQTLQQLVNTLGKPTTPATTTATTLPLLTDNLDTVWVYRDANLSPALRKQLQQVYDHRYQGDDHHYLPARNFDTEIPNEPIYQFADSLNLPIAHRMLALAKLQGTLDYLFPHKYLMDQPAQKIITQYIPQMIACTSREQYETILLKIGAAFNDSHTWDFYNQMKHRRKIFRSQYLLPFDYTLINGQLYVTELIATDQCRQAGITPGDLITTVDGINLSARIDTLATMLSASNRAHLEYRLGQYNNYLLLPTNKPVIQLTVNNNGVTKQISLPLVQSKDTGAIRQLNQYFTRRARPSAQGTGLVYPDSSMVYFNIHETFRLIEPIPDEKITAHLDSLFTRAEKAKGIIFDMRDYPDWGGFVHQVYRYFGKDSARYGRYYTVNKENVGTYTYLDDNNTYFVPGIVPEGHSYKGQVVIIVNPYTRSMSEWHTMVLQKLFPNSITIGEQSSGGDGDRKLINLPGNYEFPFTGNAIFYPDGTVAQRKGVRIDQPLQRNIADILAGRDTFLQKAIRLIKGQ
ncbi:S41 family peptidase [Paraflavitalea pollutisoli]|uniref:S41 family peptidase n=1 Tax=Paraflavitalea pollutisoli TaxID=3034143 RepID=UPI0023EC160D|nr:S41 family peptidase [Paraflavitalea sp. H1-2-19X]